VELTRTLLERHPGLCVVLYTDAADTELLDRALESGARGYAVKTGSVRELVEAIEHVARGGRYVDPRLDRVLLTGRASGRRPRLSPRERQVMALMAEGHTAEATGERLGISIETVRTHVRNVVRKLRARNRVHAIAIALERHEIALEPDEP
jgi:DNA-binding NarL/FixJ family response regulator